jgi:hypothetical protein
MSIQPTEAPAAPEAPVATNRAARRRKGKTIDPALRQHGLAGQASRAHTAAQGRRINPVRRTG